ncbi:hypothetical protein [Flavobacterium sp. SORGH_AS_0622]|jgi:hypothetical protein|uniref:hypothetical protein n=1 Tax=Flavobacterium sp. SORGH_AS_0622 TaxID=3041772 RepID=UPI0027886ADD|nr:hypothetical protein [Flavobacterium sp. SORGH_AS_0622]MDQ1165141.1 hypothetical protein [Flavobacterium sp. SORGH_AS_0622]
MEKIFDKPIILNGLDGNVVLIYGEYIIGNITKENADLNIERIDKEVFKPSEFESIINVKDVVEYEFEVGNDSHIMFGVSKEGSTSYETIDFQNVDIAKEAEKSIKEQFKALGFKREEKQLTAMQAAVSPGLVTLFVAVVGGLFTWLAYGVQDYESKRTRIVKWYVYLFEKIAKAVGYYPFLIITIVLTIICLFWMVKRMANPPYQIKAKK